MVTPDRLIAEALALFRRLQKEYTALYYSRGREEELKRLGRIKYRVYKRLQRRQKQIG